MLRAKIAAVPLMLLLSAPAGADDRIVAKDASKPAVFQNEVRVNVSMNFFVPANFDDSDAVAKAQERARKMLYQSGSQECDLLRATIADDCRLERINVNVSMVPNYRQQGQGLNATGNFGYRITLK